MAAEADKSSKPKRRLRTAPETVRERATKAQEADAKPKRSRKPSKIFAPLRPIGRALRKFGNLKPVRFIGRILLPGYFRNSWHELRLVTWPSRRESRRLTTAVMIFAIVFGVLIALVDYGLDKAFKKVILKQ